MVERVVATESALALIDRLQQKHGPVMFHQSGGCCEGSAANCLLPGELTIGAADALLGEIGGCQFYISKSQYAHWQHTQLIIDVVDARGGGYFSLEGPEGVSFHTRSRLFSPAELAELSSSPVM
ncbi:MAG: DUF779 domain-containing protein [Dechloromonas sp.]|nr:DUF779 domain-containing protein [Dechloromonas sp.]